jgi:hypothetical protein
MKSTRALGLAVVASLALGALLYRPASAPAMQEPTAPATGQQIAGISCDAQEGQRIHIKHHLVILDHGKEVHIPENVGQPAGRRCLYWLHTHTPDGIIHIEAPLNRTFTLGDFFKIWGQPLTHTMVASAKAAKGRNLKVWVNGHAFTGNPATIPLNPHADVVIEAGPPFPKPPKFTQWGKL